MKFGLSLAAIALAAGTLTSVAQSRSIWDGEYSKEQYADLIAYVLSVNKFPSGTQELPTDIEALKQIRFLATRP